MSSRTVHNSSSSWQQFFSRLKSSFQSNIHLIFRHSVSCISNELSRIVRLLYYYYYFLLSLANCVLLIAILWYGTEDSLLREQCVPKCNWLYSAVECSLASTLVAYIWFSFTLWRLWSYHMLSLCECLLLTVFFGHCCATLVAEIILSIIDLFYCMKVLPLIFMETDIE